ASSYECESNWHLFEDKCYNVVFSTGDFLTIAQRCLTMGAEMASVHSSQQFLFLRRITLNSDEASYGFWLGGKRNESYSTSFRWRDGSVWNYSDWADQHPTDPRKALHYDYVYMNSRMYVAYASSALHQLCQKQAKSQQRIAVELKFNETLANNDVSKLESRIGKIEKIFYVISKALKNDTRFL
ncbi:hypothetical protein B4U80_12298, partial [Leptotrombidium deliense]